MNTENILIGISVFSVALWAVAVSYIIFTECRCQSSDYPFCDNPKCKKQTHYGDEFGNLKKL